MTPTDSRPPDGFGYRSYSLISTHPARHVRVTLDASLGEVGNLPEPLAILANAVTREWAAGVD